MKKERLFLPIAGCVTAALFMAALALNPGLNNLQVLGADVNSASTVWGHYNRLEPTLTTAGCQEFWISCDNHEIKYEAPTTGVVEDRGTPTVADVEEWHAQAIENDRRYLPQWKIDDTHVSFGMYPTTKVENSSTISILTDKLSVKNPSADSHSGWKTYDYYVSDALRNDDHASGGIGFYQDLFVNGKTFRAVYFRFLRPNSTNNGANVANSNVDDNGYDKTTLYFFEFTPIEWRILEQNDSSIKMMATTVLDSWQYDHDTTIASWGASDMHNFINGTFYNDAFKYAQDKILDVDSTDKVTLLTYSEARNASYGFTTTNAATETRQFAPSEYAKSQGVFVYNGYGEWALRDLKSGTTLRYNVLNNGSITTTDKDVRLTAKSGILPVISLSKN